MVCGHVEHIRTSFRNTALDGNPTANERVVERDCGVEGAVDCRGRVETWLGPPLTYLEAIKCNILEAIMVGFIFASRRFSMLYMHNHACC